MHEWYGLMEEECEISYQHRRIVPENIDENAQLIGGDLGLDSIDVLELVMMLEKDYGVKIDSREIGVKIFASVAALADYVHHYQSGKSN
ncbi:MAG: phosphopantetheine-binding protein [Deltaproteobacteria bacterium]|nr:phosphopantetheine-binding protein [Deltaproteobacteria bacterium]